LGVLQNLKEKIMSNIGRIITDFYCNGFFGRDYDFNGSEIIAEGDEYIVIRKKNGIVEFGNFQNWDWNRNEDGTLASGISNLSCMSHEEKQNLIDEWCGGF
jgi:hypothetical protein